MILSFTSSKSAHVMELANQIQADQSPNADLIFDWSVQSRER